MSSIEYNQAGLKSTLTKKFTLIIFTTGFLLLALKFLMFEPVVGLADNYDFDRITVNLGLTHTQEYYDTTCFNCIDRYVVFGDSPALSEWFIKAIFSPAVLIGGIASVICQLIGEKMFDIVVLGMLYAVITSAGLYMFASRVVWSRVGWITGLTCSSMIAYIIMSPSYILYFNSFYEEATSIVSIVLILHLLVLPDDPTNEKLKTNWKYYVLFGYLMVATSMSKQQNCLAGGLMVVSLALFTQRQQVSRKAILILAIVAMVPLLVVITKINPIQNQRMEFMNRFNAIYNGIALISTDPVAILHKLNQPQASIRMLRKGDAVWVTPAEEIFWGMDINRPLIGGYSRINLLSAYLLDSQLLGAAATRTINSMSTSRLDSLGNFQKTYNNLNKRLYDYKFSWSSVRDPILTRWPTIIPVFMLIVLFMLTWDRCACQFNPFGVLLCFLLANTVTQWVVVIIGDGFVEHTKHLMLARLTLDLSLPVFVLYLVARYKQIANK